MPRRLDLLYALLKKLFSLLFISYDKFCYSHDIDYYLARED